MGVFTGGTGAGVAGADVGGTGSVVGWRDGWGAAVGPGAAVRTGSGLVVTGSVREVEGVGDGSGVSG